MTSVLKTGHMEAQRGFCVTQSQNTAMCEHGRDPSKGTRPRDTLTYNSSSLELKN